MNGDEDLAFLFRCDRVFRSRRQDEHLSAAQLMDVISGRDLHAAAQNVNVDDAVSLVCGQASESIEGEEGDGVSAATIQGFLSVAALTSLGFGSKLADLSFEVNQQLRGRESFLRVLSQPCLL
jgi:hypothetical protein